MTKKRFTYEYDEYNGNLFDNKMNTFYHIEDSDENIEVLCDRLNWLVEENEQLKTIRSDLISELDIVQNELNIAIDEGFAPSKSYKNYMASKKTEYDKFWENKIKTHNNTLKELKSE
ncbi:hypothetical protein [Methanobrevibacter sp.]|uniref:hypothetical protein n=1 Tax=Methanobrevibacter sp. TaxID=66852 RepID=UPI00386CA43E